MLFFYSSRARFCSLADLKSVRTTETSLWVLIHGLLFDIFSQQRHRDKRASCLGDLWSKVCGVIQLIIFCCRQQKSGRGSLRGNIIQLGGKITSGVVCVHTPADPATSPPHKTVKISMLSPGFYSMRLTQRWVCSSITSLALPPSIPPSPPPLSLFYFIILLLPLCSVLDRSSSPTSLSLLLPSLRLLPQALPFSPLVY